eukprot:CAMPEP_0113935162 /NCGR_PEP_ID=MMETSP1339-20121228/2371_1 /TAXON_ID=94617 /ORGANISM="Fibrocapsa japonica" /LENGTH=728 /DNA_ID=CAMNT_0000937219 /DNA_START=1 /DNA_END=2187 /DNA_ORIENTATION=- /assembly_acc=CAM_ASM_000762
MAMRAAAAGGGTLQPQPEPFALEAKHFSEVRLLNREVDLLLEGLDKYGNFYGTVLHPMGNVSVELLKHGLGRMVDWSSEFCARDRATAMRAAEREAKLGRLRLHRNWQPPQIQGDREYTGVVAEVPSADQIVVIPLTEGKDLDPLGSVEERRVALSSIKVPRQGNARRGQPDEPWAFEAKELVRSRLIGKTVKVNVEYMRDIPQGPPGQLNPTMIKRPFATVTVGKGAKAKNVAVMVIQEGLGQVIRHRQDEERSAHYEMLLAAEEQARNSKKGIHSSGAAGVNRITDLTNNSKQAKQYMPFLQRQRGLRGVIDYVFAGARFKVFIPKENCAIMLALTAVRCPQAERAASAGPQPGGARRGEPFGEEAKTFSRLKLLQRAVEIEVEAVDRNGVGLGTIYVGQGEQRHNYALDLLKAGLAKLDDRVLENARSETRPLIEAQENAQSNRLRVWSVEDPEDKKKESEANTVVQELIRVKISDISSAGRFFVHLMDDTGLSVVEEKMAAFTEEHGVDTGAPVEAKRGSLVAALFDDGSGAAWYRAKVLEVSAQKATATVLYVDHGNTGSVSFNRLRPLDPSVSHIPAQAREATLAFCKPPGVGDEYGREAAVLLNEYGWGRELLARVLGRDPETGALRLALYVSQGQGEEGAATAATANLSLNETMVEEGLARVPKSAEREAARMAKLGGTAASVAADLIQGLKGAQETARKQRAAMWRYGDVGDSDDEDGF